MNSATLDSKSLSMKLLMGSEISIDGIHLRQLKIKEIVEMGIDVYYSKIGICTVSLDKLIDKNEIPKNAKLFDVLLRNDMLRESFLNFLDVFICHDDDGIRYIEQFNEIMITYNGKAGRIGERNIYTIFDTFRKMYYLGGEKQDTLDESKAVDEETAELVREFKEFEESKKKKNTIVTIQSITETIMACSNTYNVWNVFDLTMYQLMKIYYRITFERDSRFFMQGIYAGTISSEKVKLDEYNIAKEIDV